MKKVLKRIAILICVMTLLVMPSTSALAASTPICDIDYSDPSFTIRAYSYQPDSLYLATGSSTALSDYAKGIPFFVPAGKAVNFQILTRSNAYFKVQIMMINEGLVYEDFVANKSNYSRTLPILASDKSYVLIVTAYSDLNLGSYCFNY